MPVLPQMRQTGTAHALAPGHGTQNLPLLAGFVTIAVGGSVLVGWLLGVETLKSTLPGVMTMKVNTAIGFILLGLGLALRADSDHRWRRGFGAAALVTAVGLCLAIASQYVTHSSSGLDQWLFYEPPGALGTVFANRTAPMTIIAFVALAVGVLAAGHPTMRRMTPALLLLAVTAAALNMLDVVFAEEAPTLLAKSTQMAMNTAGTIIVFGVGAMGLLPRWGPLEVFIGASPSASLARRLLVASLVAPAGLAWLRARGEEVGLFGPGFGISLMVLSIFVFLAVVIWQTARTARRAELDRNAAAEERDRFFDVSVDLLATASADGYFVRLNPAWTLVLGYELAELYARPFVSFVHPDDVASTAREVERQVGEGRSVIDFQNRYRHRDGSYHWLEWTSSPSSDGSLMYAVARDITARKAAEERMSAPAVALARHRAEAEAGILDVIEASAFAPVFQPIVDLDSGATIGFEALTRFTNGSRPDETFALALECGLSIQLERSTLTAALAEARQLPRGTWLSINVSPTLLADVGSLQAVLGLQIRPLVLEITEHEPIAAYGPLREALLALGPGVRLAVDDAGAGIANFNHLVELSPDFVKVDAGLVRGVDRDVSRQAVVAGILHFAAAAGCQVIAEGIENDSELEMLTGLGVTLGQGYLLGRPAPAETWVGAPMETRATATLAPVIDASAALPADGGPRPSPSPHDRAGPVATSAAHRLCSLARPEGFEPPTY